MLIWALLETPSACIIRSRTTSRYVRRCMGDEGIWCCRISRTKIVLVIEDSCKLELNSFLRNGDFLFVRCNKMFLYSPGKKIFTELDKNGVTVHNRQIGGIGSGTSSRFGFVHKPSFVSLKDMFGIDDNSIEGLNLRLRHSTQISHCLHFFVVVTISG